MEKSFMNTKLAEIFVKNRDAIDGSGAIRLKGSFGSMHGWYDHAHGEFRRGR